MMIDQTLPDHVPAELVVDANIFNLPGADTDPQLAWKTLDRGKGLVWTPHNGGHWIATSAELIWQIYPDVEQFSAREISVPIGHTIFPMIPNQSDEPDHHHYRRTIMPFLLPKAVRDLQEAVRALAAELIAGFHARGACEFMNEFARHLPMRIFLSLVNLPDNDRPWLLDRAEVMVRSGDTAARIEAQKEMIGYLRSWIDERRENPGTDMLSAIVHGTVGDRKMTEAEIMGESLDVMFGGLDTVASMMGFVMRHLATHPDQYRQLRDEPKRIALAVEEMFRRFAVASPGRMAARDVTHNGITVKAGEMIILPTCLHGLDERQWDQPELVDFDRKRATHCAFGYGIHTCPGAGLARSEVAIMIEEWIKSVPEIQIDPDRKPVCGSGMVNGMIELHLVWPV
jgi:cytochrome P450